jgi:hypothetical protein
MSVVFPLWLKANGQVLMAGFLCLDALCDPYDGPAMIAWLQAFLGFPPPFGIPSIANRLVFNACQGRFAGAAPGENLKRIINKRRTEVNRVD